MFSLGLSKFFQDGFGKDFPYSVIRKILTITVLKKLELNGKSSKVGRIGPDFFSDEIITYTLLFYNGNGDVGTCAARHPKNLQNLGKQLFLESSSYDI